MKIIANIFILAIKDPVNKDIGKKIIKYIFFFSKDVKLANFKVKFIILSYLTLILIAWNKKLYILKIN